LVNKLNVKLLANNAVTTEFDNAVIHLADVLQVAIKKSIPAKTGNFKLTQTAPSTRLLIQKRNKLGTLWQKTQYSPAPPYKTANTRRYSRFQK
jgi:hypothetical protein